MNKAEKLQYHESWLMKRGVHPSQPAARSQQYPKIKRFFPACPYHPTELCYGASAGAFGCLSPAFATYARYRENLGNIFFRWRL